MVYPLLRAYFKLALGVFYRRREVVGAAHVPAEGPLLVVANHPNALVDGLLIASALERPLSLTAKSTLAEAPIVGALFRAAHVVPIHRARDVGAGADPSRNRDSLAEIQRRLAAGGALLLFPEGQSHNDPAMRRFRHGAAQLALDYVASGNQGQLRILPVGLHNEAKTRYRSRTLLRFGPAMVVGAWRKAHLTARPRELTQALRDRLEGLALEFADRGEEVLLHRAAELLELRGEAPPTLGRPGPSLAERVALIERLQTGYRTLRSAEEEAAESPSGEPESATASHLEDGDATRIELESEHDAPARPSTAPPYEVSELATRVVAFRRRLRTLGIAPRELHISMHPLRVLRFALREGLLLVVGLPLAAWGYLNHALPYLATRLAARRLSAKPDQVASYAVFGALVLFPVAYLLQLGFAWWLLPARWAALYTVALPLTGLVALRLGTRLGAMRRRIRAFLRLASDAREREALVAESHGIVDEIRGLAEALERPS